MRQGGEPQGVQVVRQGEPTPYHCGFNRLYRSFPAWFAGGNQRVFRVFFTEGGDDELPVLLKDGLLNVFYRINALHTQFKSQIMRRKADFARCLHIDFAA